MAKARNLDSAYIYHRIETLGLTVTKTRYGVWIVGLPTAKSEINPVTKRFEGWFDSDVTVTDESLAIAVSKCADLLRGKGEPEP